VLCPDDENLECISLSYHIGVAIAKMHDSDVVHGDLTTSNMMVNDKCNGQVVRISISYE
jgi:tRNA A-37 threonylcarbamoyl transferase component Bud32